MPARECSIFDPQVDDQVNYNCPPNLQKHISPKLQLEISGD